MQSYSGCNNTGLDEDAFLLPNKDSVRTAPVNPANSNGRKSNICPSPVSDINTTDGSPDMWCRLLLHNSIKQVLSQLAQGWRGGPSLAPDTSRFRQRENQGVETDKHASNGLVEQLHVRGLSCMPEPEYLC